MEDIAPSAEGMSHPMPRGSEREEKCVELLNVGARDFSRFGTSPRTEIYCTVTAEGRKERSPWRFTTCHGDV